jgi:hypothetical protein
MRVVWVDLSFRGWVVGLVATLPVTSALRRGRRILGLTVCAWTAVATQQLLRMMLLLILAVSLILLVIMGDERLLVIILLVIVVLLIVTLMMMLPRILLRMLGDCKSLRHFLHILFFLDSTVLRSDLLLTAHNRWRSCKVLTPLLRKILYTAAVMLNLREILGTAAVMLNLPSLAMLLMYLLMPCLRLRVYRTWMCRRTAVGAHVYAGSRHIAIYLH